MEEVNTLDSKNEERNDQNAHCTKCDCLLLRPGHGVLVNIETQLPTVFTATSDLNNKEKLSRFYCVDDIYTFENMGFSKNVDDTKYLACAECEMGPLGYHDLVSKKSYLSLDRVTLK